MLLAYKAALASERVTATAIEASEFPAFADANEVWAVPKVVVNRIPQYEGALPEPLFVQRLVAPAFE